MKFIILLIQFLLLICICKAQNVESWEKTEIDKKEVRRFRNNIFHGIGIAPGTAVDLFKEVDVNTNQPDRYYVGKELRLTLFSFEYDFRYNILNHKDYFSIGINLTPFYTMHIPDFIIWEKSAGLPVGISFNFKNHATFNNIDNYGHSLILGAILPLLDNRTDLRSSRINSTPAKYREAYFRYTLKFQYYTTSINSKRTYKNKYAYIGFQCSKHLGKSFPDPYQNVHSFEGSFKIVFGKIINY